MEEAKDGGNLRKTKSHRNPKMLEKKVGGLRKQEKNGAG